MIRNNRVFIMVNIAGACLALVAGVLWAIGGRPAGFIPVWVNVAIYLSLAGAFVYQIVRRLRYGVPTTRISDRQMWIVRGTLMLLLAIVFIVVMWQRLHL